MNRSDPTYENQLWHARRLLKEKGADAFNNPHAMIGRTCKCGGCFCCAAKQVYREYLFDKQAKFVADTCDKLLNE